MIIDRNMKFTWELMIDRHIIFTPLQKKLISRSYLINGDSMSEEYPSAAFVITLIGAILSLFGWLIIAFTGIFIASAEGDQSTWMGGVCISISVIGAALGFWAALWMRKPEKAHSGGILAIISAIITIWSGIPFILLLIGGILALTWKKPEEKAVILPPPPPS